jgi:calcineurin-like phosphoesterase
VFTVLGQTFMRGKTDCPFAKADALLEMHAGHYDAAFVEIHGEVTSEKIAMGWHLDGRAAAVVGTHTHVATADNRVLPGGTAYQTDAGMCGAHEGVIGRDKEAVIQAFLDGLPRRFEIAEGDVRINGCLITYDEAQKRAVAVSRFRL